MPTGNVYSDAELIKKLQTHVIDEHLSKYTMAYPIWSTYLQRMEKDAEFKSKIHNLLMIAEQWWEKQGVTALHDKEYNNMMWTKMTCNKAFTKDHVAIDLEDRIKELENAKLTK